MLKDFDLTQKISKEDYNQLIHGLESQLSSLQQTVKEKKLPVIILLEGWGAAGKGGLISDLILNLDPRGFQVFSVKAPDENERRMPPMWRFWNKIPEAGKFSIFDRSWYYDVTVGALDEKRGEKKLARMTQEISNFERQLTDGGYLILKFFLHISKKEQKKRFQKLKENPATAWRITERDERHHNDYEKHLGIFDRALEATDSDFAPWHILSAHDKRWVRVQLYRTVIEEIERALTQAEAPAPKDIPLPQRFQNENPPSLGQADLSQTVSDADYRRLLKEKQSRLRDLHNLLYLKRVPMVIAYEGWDAAGKGGNIKRVAAALDPRGYEVIPVAAPSTAEKNHHYLWRFWNHLPRTGHIAIFDRTWYGRVMVERIEGFCSEREWKSAFMEMDEFEEQLHNWGAIVLKFWIQIDKETQLARFTERENTPEKRWKITDEDWRNREKWDAYESAVGDMLRYSSPKFAPWHIIESNDKHFARLKTLQIIIDAIEERLGLRE